MENSTYINHMSHHHHNRTEIPNLIIDVIKCPYAFRLYATYKRIAGDVGRCWVKNINLAESCGMSERKLREVKKYLASPFKEFDGKPLIIIENRKNNKGHRQSDLVTIVDIWYENVDHFHQKKSPQAPHAAGPVAPHAAGPVAPHAAGSLVSPVAPGAEPKEEPIYPFKKEPCLNNNNKGPAEAGGADAPIESLTASSVCSEQIVYEDMGGNAKSITKSEIYRQFLRKPFPTEVLEEAVKTLIDKSPQVNNVIKYLEGICNNLLQQKKTQRGCEKPKPKPIPEYHTNRDDLRFFTAEEVEALIKIPSKIRI